MTNSEGAHANLLQDNSNTNAQLQTLSTRSAQMRSLLQTFAVITAHQNHQVWNARDKVDQMDTDLSEKCKVIDFGRLTPTGLIRFYSELAREEALQRIVEFLGRDSLLDKKPIWCHYTCMDTGTKECKLSRHTHIYFSSKLDASIFTEKVNEGSRFWVIDSGGRGDSMPLFVHNYICSRLKRYQLPFNLARDCLTAHIFHTKCSKSADNTQIKCMRAAKEEAKTYRYYAADDEIWDTENNVLIFKCVFQQEDEDTVHCYVDSEIFLTLAKYWTRCVINYFGLDSVVKNESDCDSSPYGGYRLSTRPENIWLSRAKYQNEYDGDVMDYKEFNRLYVFDFTLYNESHQRVLAKFAFHTGALHYQFLDIRDLPADRRREPSPDRSHNDRRRKRARLNNSNGRASRRPRREDVGQESDSESDGSANSSNRHPQRR